MREDNPFEGWLFVVEMSRTDPLPERAGSDLGTGLRRLAELLAAAPAGKVDYNKLRGGALSIYAPYSKATPAEAAEAQRLFGEVWERGGAGQHHVQVALLKAIALALTDEAIPFWERLFDLTRPRDQLTNLRRTYAVSALALLAIANTSAPAEAALAAALSHPHEQVRALAAAYLAEVYARTEQPLPPASEAAFEQCALTDPAFAPRFQARMALGLLERPVPLDPPETVYTFEVRHKYDSTRATRTLALYAHHTLDDLHEAIQKAFKWDNDHLYAFYMNGERYATRYEIIGPHLDSETELFAWELSLAALGLVPEHTFLYFFDFGDSHEFLVKVLGVAVEPGRKPNAAPRLVAAKGSAPRQYQWEDEEDEEDEGEA